MKTHFWGSHFGYLLICPEFNFYNFPLLPLALDNVTLQYVLLFRKIRGFSFDERNN